MKGLVSLPYYGGKSALGRHRIGAWISRQLPRSSKYTTYVEPFAGMCGVLLQRPPVENEIINDLNKNIVNWWTVVRDRPDDLIYYLRNSPYWCRKDLVYAEKVTKQGIKIKDPVRKAYFLTIMLLHRRIPSDSEFSSGFRFPWVKKARGTVDVNIIGRIKRLSNRVKNIEIRNMDAMYVVEDFADNRNSVLYLDPPYRTAHTRPYGKFDEFNLGEFNSILENHAGKIAISGYNDEWDHLDWKRNELQVKQSASNQENERIEVLWTNFAPVKQRRLFS